jgi:cell division protein FtsL
MTKALGLATAPEMEERTRTKCFVPVETHHLTVEQPTADTPDNRGKMQMTTAQQPKLQMRHVDMKQVVIPQWSEREDLISFTNCPSALLVADHVTKQTGCPKFCVHMHVVMGQRKPKFSPANQCAINVVPVSHNIRQLCCEKTVGSMLMTKADRTHQHILKKTKIFTQEILCNHCCFCFSQSSSVSQ